MKQIRELLLVDRKSANFLNIDDVYYKLVFTSKLKAKLLKKLYTLFIKLWAITSSEKFYINCVTFVFKVLTNEKTGGLNLVSSIGLPLSCSPWDFLKNLCRPGPGLKLLSEPCLKVLTNEKRGGLSVVSFDRSPFKLFSLKFSNRLVQAPSCERHKTALRTLFVSFANNNYFQIAV